ncbi:HEAT repeat domain-containing protein [Rugosimonospora africana]|nr:HEAT repeat domain-containing protein [Rugosimonospora africana]
MPEAARTVPELIAEALSATQDGDEDRRWRAVDDLRAHGDAWHAARQLCRSPEPARRELGVDVLARLRTDPTRPAGEGPSPESVVTVLLDLVNGERDPGVLRAVATGLGHLRDPRAVGPLSRLRAHPDAEVRGAVVFGLLGRPEREALDTLIELSADQDPYVRDWATFGLARRSDADFAELRDALAARLRDPDPDARAEAVHGLATRGDARATGPLLDALDGQWNESDPSVIEEALSALAAATGDPRLTALAAERAADPDRD